jgi:acetyl esterase/lipase
MTTTRSRRRATTGASTIAAIAAIAALGLTVTACSSRSVRSTPAAIPAASGSATAALHPCPRSAVSIPSSAPAPAGSGQHAPSFPTAKTIKQTDTSTSTVITPTGPQMQCGRTELSSHDDIVYASPTTHGKQTRLLMDIQAPRTGGSHPLVVYLPGGGFLQADPSGNLDQRTYVAEQGYVVASIAYRTVNNGATYKDAVSDVQSAIRYLRLHAGQYGVNPGEVAVWGQSAGGYLAAMTGVDRSSDVQAVVDEFGPADLSAIGADYDAAARTENTAPGNATAQWVYGPGTRKSVASYTPQVAAADPDSYADSGTPPFVLFHGSADHLVSPSQTLKLSDTLKAKGAQATRYVVEGADHGDLSFMGNTTSARDWTTLSVMGRITDFLHRHLA